MLTSHHQLLFATLAVASSCLAIVGCLTPRISRQLTWWICVTVGFSLSIRSYLYDTAPTGGTDFILPLFCGYFIAIYGGRGGSSNRCDKPSAFEVAGFIGCAAITAWLTTREVVPWNGRMSGIWLSPNLNALAFVPGLVWGVSIVRRATAHRDARLSLFLGISICLGLAILQTQTLSRAGVICMALGTLVYFVRCPVSAKRRFLVIVVAVTCAMGFVAASGDLRERLIEPIKSVDLSFRHRLIVLEGLLGLMTEEPFMGQGWNNMDRVWASYARPSHMNSVYGGAGPWIIDMGVRAGIPVVWGTLTLLLLGFVRRRISEISEVTSASVIALAIGGLGTSFMDTWSLNCVFWLLLGYSVGSLGQHAQTDALRSLLVAGVCTGVLAGVGLWVRPAVGWHDEANGTRTLTNRDRVRWVLHDARPAFLAESGASNIGFWRQLAEVDGTYRRQPCPDSELIREWKRDSDKQGVPLVFLVDTSKANEQTKMWAREQEVPVIELRPAVARRVPHISVALEPDSRICRWSVDYRFVGDFAGRRDRLLAALLARILALEAGGVRGIECHALNAEAGNTEISEDRCLAEARECLSLDVFDRRHVLRALRCCVSGSIDEEALVEDSWLAWKVRDRFYREIKPEKYARWIMSPVFDCRRHKSGWRKPYFQHYYAAVYGIPDIPVAVQVIADQTIWNTVTRSYPSLEIIEDDAKERGATYANGVSLIEDCIAACRAVGIAAYADRADMTQGCFKYLTRDEQWMTFNFLERWSPVANIGCEEACVR
jgi:hypothetical protein